MAPPPSSLAPAIHPVVREVTEDTPPDLLEGTMDLLVILPSKANLRMTVNRRTPMMDLLVQVTTANKINTAGHVVQVRNERGMELKYHPSTPIGMLDTTLIEIVPKNQLNESLVKHAASIKESPVEPSTFRLQVNLPRNQLHIMRVGKQTTLQDILEDTCQVKQLDIAKYEIRHPVNLDQKLSLTCCLDDYKLQKLKQVTVVSRNSRINSSVSTADIMALQQHHSEDGRPKGCLDSAFKYSRSSVGDSSVSSESAASARGTSPSRSEDDSRSVSPLPPITQPKLNLKATPSSASSSTIMKSSTTNLTKATSTLSMTNSNLDLSRPKKRAAPPPPQSPAIEALPQLPQAIHKPLSHSLSQPPPVPRKKNPPKEPPGKAVDNNHSRHSSDSSGYHESSGSILSDNQQDLGRAERPMSATKRIGSLNSLSNQGMTVGSSTTNLTSVSSLSSTSLASSNGGSRNKRKAPKPPASLQAQKELDEEAAAAIEHESPILTRSGLELDVQVDVHHSDEGDEGTLKPGTASPASSSFSSPTLTKSGTSSASSTTSSSRSSSSPANSKASMAPLSSKVSNPSMGTGGSPASTSDVLESSSNPPASSPTSRPASSTPTVQDHTSHEDEASSESEASYADSGIPATTTVTPSPISLDHEDLHESHHSEKSHSLHSSSRRSSLQSDHSETWREVLQSKVDGQSQQNATETTTVHESERVSHQYEERSPSPPGTEQIKVTPNYETSKRPESPVNLPAKSNLAEELESLSSASDEERKEKVKVKAVQEPETKVAEEPKVQPVQELEVKLAQEPDVKHVQEAEVKPAKKPEVKLAQPPKVKPVQEPEAKHVQEPELKLVKEPEVKAEPRKMPKAESFSHHSEFDVVKTKRRTFASSGLSRQAGRTATYGSSSEEEERLGGSMTDLNISRKTNNASNLQRAGKSEERSSRKTASVMGLEELAPEVRAHPELLESFQVELENQFEQWKEDFLQRHLGKTSKSGSLDSGSANEELQQQEKSSIKNDAEPKQSNLSSHSSSSISLKVSDEEAEDFDPAQPQIVHSVGSRSPAPRASSEESAVESITPAVVAESVKASRTESEDVVKEDETDMNDIQIVNRRLKPAKPANAPDTTVYRYSGPPAIQMGTWGERPHRTISVKKDKDYIMGMGQQDGKVEAKSANSIASRVHSFSGGSPTPGSGSNKTLPASRWSNVTIGPEPNQSASGGTLPSVVSSWKLRLEESEKARKSSQESLGRAGSLEPEPKIEIKSMSATSTLERPKSSKPSFSISSASSTLERPIKRTPSPAMFSISQATTTTTAPLKTSTTPEPRKYPTPEPKVVTIDTVDSAKHSPVTVSHTKVQATQSFSTPNTNGSMEEKKRFFQGIKPVESPTKEVPIPAVNLKTNIATIQKVFEQRQLQKSSSTASISGSERSSPSRESSASPAFSTSSYSSSSSAKKTEFIGSQSNSNIMVQKLFSRGSAGFSFNAHRRSPSPSVTGSYNDSERSTPSPTVIEGQGPIRVSTTGHNIKNVGNKAIITVGAETSSVSVNNNQFKQQLRVNGESYQPTKVSVNANVNGKSNDSMIIVNSSGNNQPSNYASIKETFSKNKPVIVQETVKEPIAKRNSVGRNNASVPPPPPPPPSETDTKRPTSLTGLTNKLSRSSTGNSSLSSTTPTTPASPSTSNGAASMADILNAIKSSNGNFGLKKTNSTMLLR